MKRLRNLCLGLLLALTLAPPASADQMLGRIAPFAFPFCPTGWVRANGQTLPIQNYTALFALFGNTYGGDGYTTFQLPNLSARTPIHVQAPVFPLGAKRGHYQIQLPANSLVPHIHSFSGSAARSNVRNPSLAQPGSYPPGAAAYAQGADIVYDMSPHSVGTAGQNAMMDIRQPYLVITYCVAVSGYFPHRS